MSSAVPPRDFQLWSRLAFSDINKLAVDLDEALGTFRTFALTGYDEKLFPSILHLNINTITAKDAGTWIILYLALM